MRQNVHYWKCDRPAALHGVARREDDVSGAALLPALTRLLTGAFPALRSLRPAGGKGNHRTYVLELPSARAFVRVEDGPERDEHLAMESRVMTEVAKTGVPVPRVLFTDASRTRVPFAVQVIEHLDCPDLNSLHREGLLDLPCVAFEIGRGVARWQDTPVAGFGPFDPEASERSGRLTGYHAAYADYFRLQLSRHLALLQAADFLTLDEATRIQNLITEHEPLLEIDHGRLVHKDLALWNIMGTPEAIRAFIDWDDAIAGDPTDDLSLLACFHPAAVVQSAVDGYASIRPLPANFQRRFWIHLLRNMIVKSVIRCEAGYFAPATRGAFLMASGQDGPAFRKFTSDHLWRAFHGLRDNLSISALSN